MRSFRPDFVTVTPAAQGAERAPAMLNLCFRVPPARWRPPGGPLRLRLSRERAIAAPVPSPLTDAMATDQRGARNRPATLHESAVAYVAVSLPGNPAPGDPAFGTGDCAPAVRQRIHQPQAVAVLGAVGTDVGQAWF